MKCKVTLYVLGKVIEEVVEARDYADARSVALRRNSENAKVVGVTAIL